jgi:hypothetical protein
MIPINLAYGEVSIYGIYNIGIQGIAAPSGYAYGFIDQVSVYGISYSEVGQSVLWKNASRLATIRYSGNTYSIIDEDSILGTEQ